MTQQREPMDAASALALLNQVTYETQEGQSPLRDFYGRLAEIKVTESPQTNDDGTVRMTFRLQYMFDQVRVIHAISSWPYATADLSFYINDPAEAPQPTNRTGIFFDSIQDIEGKQVKPPDSYGKMFHIKWLDGHAMKRRKSAGVFEDYIGPAYRVVDVDGKPSATPWVENVPTPGEQAVINTGTPAPQAEAVPQPVPVPDVDIDAYLVSIATGKNHPATVAAWMDDVRVTSDPELFGKIVTDNGGAVANRLMNEGKMVSIEGVYGIPAS